MVISGDPHDICRLLYGFWRPGIDETEAGAEGLIAWQVAAGKAPAGKTVGAQATANEDSAERAFADIADAALEVATEVS